MTLAELKTKANAKLADIWTVIQAKEDAYFAKHGKYFGIRWSPVAEVVDGVGTDPVINRPSRGHVAEDVDFPATQVPFKIQIFRISQEDNETYQAFVRVQLPNGDKWERNRYQDNTDSGWYQVIQI